MSRLGAQPKPIAALRYPVDRIETAKLNLVDPEA